MNISSNNILDLPDEILQLIFHQLNLVDMFYSLVNVNERFDRLVLDPFHVHHLNFAMKTLDSSGTLRYTNILERICERVLPRINDKVIGLTIEPLSIEHVLSNVAYPQLRSLSFSNFQPKELSQYLTNKIVLDLLVHQITHVTVDIILNPIEIVDENNGNIFELILLHGTRLNDFTVLQNSRGKYVMNWSVQYDCLSSTLTKLTINVGTFDGCLYLLNGCLPSLSTLFIRILRIDRYPTKINNTRKLLKLKHFSLLTNQYTCDYDRKIVPLLRRMSNLEELTLFLSVLASRHPYIDGDQLYEDVLKFMPQLNKFIFSIHTTVMSTWFKTIMNLRSNEMIRNSFIERGFQSIGLCADEQLLDNQGICHVYSLPYQFNEFWYLNNRFQGGKFDKVRLLSMSDQRPFEHQLFEIISKDFPFLQTLIISNNERAKNEQHSSSRLITFNYLSELNLLDVHPTYLIQFLSEKITRVPCLRNLIVRYEGLAAATDNFTDDATRFNCTKIEFLSTYQQFAGTKHFYSYFPSLYR